MNADILKTVMEMTEQLGKITKVSAFDNNIYIDGETEDNKTFHLTMLFEEKESEDDTL